MHKRPGATSGLVAVRGASLVTARQPRTFPKRVRKYAPARRSDLLGLQGPESVGERVRAELREHPVQHARKLVVFERRLGGFGDTRHVFAALRRSRR